MEEQEAGQQDGEELPGCHDGGKYEGPKGLDGVTNKQGACHGVGVGVGTVLGSPC